MEIPLEYKKLYNHWEYHSNYPIEFNKNPQIDTTLLSSIEKFITERMKIWERKYKEEEKPYTKDPILENYRFCNIYRELDKQTIQIHNNLKNVKDNFDLWLLNLSFYRFVCNPETVNKVGLLNFNSTNNGEVYEKLLNLPSPKYGSAYIFPISIIQNSEYNTREKFFCLYLPKIIENISTIIQKFNNVPVNEALDSILRKFGFNFRFHMTEILIDVAYQYPEKIDLYKNFYIGPGAIPTFEKFKDKEIIKRLVSTKLDDFPYLEYEGNPIYLSAENWEGIFCEYRKYSNLQNGKGRKRLYH
jgi:hypothetical protein